MPDLLYNIIHDDTYGPRAKVIGNTPKGRTWLATQDPTAIGVYVIEAHQLQLLLNAADRDGVSFAAVTERGE